MVGKIFNKWKILKFSKKVGYAKYFWCECLDCHKEKEVYIGNVINGRSKSCGCKTKKCKEDKRNKNDYYIIDDVAYVIFSNNNNIMKCDSQDWETMKQYTWFLDGTGYARTSIDKKHPAFHRMVLGIEDRNIQIDHINKDKTDNRRSNLRICNNQENSFNKRKYVTNTSGYKGVYFDKDREKWRGAIMIDGKSYKSPKRYNTPEEAYEWYKEMSDRLFEEYSVFESDKIAPETIEIIETNVG